MRRPLLLAVTALAGCTNAELPPYALLTVQDPIHVGLNANALVIGSALDDPSSERHSLEGHAFPVELALSSPTEGRFTVWVEAVAGQVPIGRGSATVMFTQARPATAVIELAKPCATDTECDDGAFCNGQETCEGHVCVGGRSPCGSSGFGCVLSACLEQAHSCTVAVSHAACDATIAGGFCEPLSGCVATRSCASDRECRDADSCDGTEHCKSGACVRGGSSTDGVPCLQLNRMTGACMSGQCAPRSCPEGASCVTPSGSSEGVCKSGACAPCPGDRCVRAVAAGLAHSCAVMKDAALCWGTNLHRQLGIALSQSQSTTPVAVPGVSGTFLAVASGDTLSCVVVDGAEACWGGATSLAPHQEPGPSDISSVSIGLSDGLCVLAGGAVLCPAPVMGLSSGVSAVAVGGAHICVVQSGAVLCWGDNSYQQLGPLGGTSRLSDVPLVALNSSHHASLIAAGSAHSCALADGGVWCWGLNDRGQLGNPSVHNRFTANPVPVIGATAGVSSLAAGGDKTCAVVDGGALCWGGRRVEDAPAIVPGLEHGVTAVAVGGAHACALVYGGVACWGDNSSGQLGNTSTSTYSAVPVKAL